MDLLQPSFGQKTLQKLGEERLSKSVFSRFAKTGRFSTKIHGLQGKGA